MKDPWWYNVFTGDWTCQGVFEEMADAGRCVLRLRKRGYAPRVITCISQTCTEAAVAAAKKEQGP